MDNKNSLFQQTPLSDNVRTMSHLYYVGESNTIPLEFDVLCSRKASCSKEESCAKYEENEVLLHPFPKDFPRSVSYLKMT